MYRPVYTKQFKLIERSLLAGKILDPILRDHKLIGNYAGRRECHIESDWFLVYKIDKDMLILKNVVHTPSCSSFSVAGTLE